MGREFGISCSKPLPQQGLQNAPKIVQKECVGLRYADRFKPQKSTELTGSNHVGRRFPHPTAQGYHGVPFTVQQHFTVSNRLFHRNPEETLP